MGRRPDRPVGHTLDPRVGHDAGDVAPGGQLADQGSVSLDLEGIHNVEGLVLGALRVERCPQIALGGFGHGPQRPIDVAALGLLGLQGRRAAQIRLGPQHDDHLSPPLSAERFPDEGIDLGRNRRAGSHPCLLSWRLACQR